MGSKDGQPLDVSLGVVGLGDTLISIWDRVTSLPNRAEILATTYRPEQRVGIVPVVVWNPEGLMKPRLLASITIPLCGKPRAAAEQLHIGFDADVGRVRVVCSGGAKEIVRTASLPEDRKALDALAESTLSDPAGAIARLPLMRAEVLLRWYRGLLRERMVRARLRDLAGRTRDITDTLEAAVSAGDLDAVMLHGPALYEAGRQVAHATGITPFPADDRILLLPDTL